MPPFMSCVLRHAVYRRFDVSYPFHAVDYPKLQNFYYQTDQLICTSSSLQSRIADIISAICKRLRLAC